MIDITKPLKTRDGQTVNVIGMAEVVRFLMGEAPLEGRWFDEPDPHVGGAYWWRKHLTEALAPQPAATSETVNVIGMPEFDGLLDYIYEHGTAAEGVIEKANAFARAVIARFERS